MPKRPARTGPPEPRGGPCFALGGVEVGGRTPEWLLHTGERLLRGWLAAGAVLVGPARRLVDPEAERQVNLVRRILCVRHAEQQRRRRLASQDDLGLRSVFAVCTPAKCLSFSTNPNPKTTTPPPRQHGAVPGRYNEGLRRRCRCLVTRRARPARATCLVEPSWLLGAAGGPVH